MPNNVEKMTLNYSPNFDLEKRHKKLIKYIIFHYTGMKSDKLAIEKLTNLHSKVSCHYYIDRFGKLIKMVPESYIAWHAGVSKWEKNFFLNKYSIGIEIHNPGHQYFYKNFNSRQIKTLIYLLKKIIKKYDIKKKNILGHSDISPLRKKDPGEKFPWKKLSKLKIGLWHNINQAKCKFLRAKKSNQNDIFFLKELKKFGYTHNIKNKSQKQKVIMSFQRRFRPELINGQNDKECELIIKSLNSNKK